MKLVTACLFAFLLFFWEVDVLKADTTMGTSALEKSKHCIEAAREAYDLLMKEEADDSTTSGVIKHLEALAEDGKFLHKTAEGVLSKLESQEKDFDKTLQQLQKEKQQFEQQVQASQKQKANIEQSQSAKESVLQDNQKHLQTAEKELQDADNELQRAKKKAKKRKRGLFGGLVSGLEDLVGIVNNADKKVKRAKKNIDRKKSELTSAQNAASSTKKALADIQNTIKQHESKIQATQQQADKKHQEIGSVKSSIALLQKSTYFWELFVVATENAEERTAALKRVVDLAAEKKDYEVLRGDGTVTKAKSFIEAWGIIATDHRIE